MTYATDFSSFCAHLMYSFTCFIHALYMLFMIVTTSFLGCTLFAVIGLCGSFLMYLMHEICNLFDHFFWLFCVLLPILLPASLLCCLTFLFQLLQQVVLVVPFFLKMASTMLNTSIISRILRLVFQVIALSFNLGC